MTEKSLSRMLGRYFGPKLQQQYRKAEILGLAALCFLASGTASAGDALKDVSFQPLPGGVVEIALEVALDVLKPGGTFVGKVFQGGSSSALLMRLKKSFREVY